MQNFWTPIKPSSLNLSFHHQINVERIFLIPTCWGDILSKTSPESGLVFLRFLLAFCYRTHS